MKYVSHTVSGYSKSVPLSVTVIPRVCQTMKLRNLPINGQVKKDGKMNPLKSIQLSCFLVHIITSVEKIYRTRKVHFRVLDI